MSDNNHYTALIQEANNSNTASERLSELARNRALAPLVASNPATPGTTLEHLAAFGDNALRHAIALNPNTPFPLLHQLAQEFPQEFLANPVLPLLTLTEPDFISSASTEMELQLLRCEDMPAPWVQQIIQKSFAPRTYRSSYYTSGDISRNEITSIAEKHVSFGDPPAEWESIASSKIQEFETHLQQKKNWKNEVLVSLLHAIPATILSIVAEKYITHIRSLSPSLTFLPKIYAKSSARLSQHEQDLAFFESVWQRLQKRDSKQEELEASNNTYQRLLELQRRLAEDQDDTIVQTVAAHPRTEPGILRKLAHHQAVTVRLKVARHHYLPDAIYQHLSRDTDIEIRIAVARNVHTPQSVLYTLAQDAELSVRVAAAQNPRLPDEAIVILSKDSADEIRIALASNARLPENLQWVFANDPLSIVRKQLAANPRTSLVVLETLAQEQDPEVLSGVARHPRVSPTLLARLALIQHEELRAAVAGNKRTPPDVLTMLCQQSTRSEYWHTWDVWKRLGSNPHTPLHVLKYILLQGQLSHKLHMINHPALQRDRHGIFMAIFREGLRLEKVMDISLLWRFYLLRLPNTPIPLLQALAHSMYWQERYLVAGHTTTPRSVLKTLSHDGHMYVRAAARQALHM